MSSLAKKFSISILIVKDIYFGKCLFNINAAKSFHNQSVFLECEDDTPEMTRHFKPSLYKQDDQESILS